MWFGVLGPLEVRDAAGRVVHVGGSVRRELLAALLCRAGEAVPAAALIDDIWGDVPPRTAAKATAQRGAFGGGSDRPGPPLACRR